MHNLEFVQGVHFEFINSLKNNCTKYLINFDDSWAAICNYKEYVDIATAGRLRGFSTIYIEHNLLNQSKLGRNVELQNTHIVFFKSARDLHQVATLKVQLRLGSALVDWYRDATCDLLVIYWLIRLREQTMAYATAKIAEIFHQNFFPENLKNLKHLDGKHNKSLYSLGIPTLFPRGIHSQSSLSFDFVNFFIMHSSFLNLIVKL